LEQEVQDLKEKKDNVEKVNSGLLHKNEQ